MNSARSWLASEGFKVGATSRDRITIPASGTAAQVEKAFGTRLGNYKVNGRVVRLATPEMSVPASVAGSVVGALGINQSVATTDARRRVARASATVGVRRAVAPSRPRRRPSSRRRRAAGTTGRRSTTVRPPFGHGYPRTVPDQVCGYKPGQFRSAYNVGSDQHRKGVTVAIIDAYGSATINE